MRRPVQALAEWTRLASAGEEETVVGADDATEPAYTPRSDLGDLPQAMATLFAAVEVTILTTCPLRFAPPPLRPFTSSLFLSYSVHSLPLIGWHAQDQNMNRIKLMVGGGAVDVNDSCDLQTGDTLLHKAASTSFVEAMVLNGYPHSHQERLLYAVSFLICRPFGLQEEMVNAGGDVNKRNTMGLTPLHVASIEGQMDSVSWLLARGADPSLQDEEGYIPLHYAAAEGQMEIIKALVPISDLLARTKLGLSALHVAVASKRSPPVEYLLRKKPALASMPDEQGKLPAGDLPSIS